MLEYLKYYSSVIARKLKFLYYGKVFQVNLWRRLTHDNIMLSPSFARRVVRARSLSESELHQDTDYLDLIKHYRSSQSYCVDYWVNHYQIVPDQDIREFLTDSYLDSGKQLDQLLISNRDKFFNREGSGTITYSKQVSEIISECLEDRE